ncbi:hypothetical protein Bca101_077529 [Brassica carinata]
MANKETNLSSLPDEMIINCLAHLSRSYHPKLSLVSKRFRSLILSSELLFARSHLKTQEHVLDVCLKLPGCRLPSWFSLWIRPDQILTNDMEEDKSTTRNTLLVPIPSSYSPYVADLSMGMVGSKHYKVRDYNIPPTPSPILWVVARQMKPLTRLKYSTQILKLGSLYLTLALSSARKWGVVIEALQFERKCVIENVWYYCGEEYCSWFDTKLQKWKMVKGLEVLNRNCCAGALAIANYCGKLLILWDKPGHGENKNIWCSVIALERDRDGDDVWGHIEWASVVLTVPSSYVFLHCRQVWG